MSETVDPSEDTDRRRTCYVTLDVDWAPDLVLHETLDLLEELELPVTVFVTHATPALERWRASPLVELGVHPNFNDLLNGDAPAGTSMRRRVEEVRSLAPDARVVRSHSLTQNSRLLDLFAEQGFTHEANVLVPWSSHIPLRPWRHWDRRLLRVPMLFEDSVEDLWPGAWDAARLLAHPGLRVLSLHPIRLFLNARDVVLPPVARTPDADPAALRAARRAADEPGSRSLLRALVARHRGAGGAFGTIGRLTLDRACGAGAA